MLAARWANAANRSGCLAIRRAHSSLKLRANATASSPSNMSALGPMWMPAFDSTCTVMPWRSISAMRPSPRSVILSPTPRMIGRHVFRIGHGGRWRRAAAADIEKAEMLFERDNAHHLSPARPRWRFAEPCYDRRAGFVRRHRCDGWRARPESLLAMLALAAPALRARAFSGAARSGDRAGDARRSGRYRGAPDRAGARLGAWHKASFSSTSRAPAERSACRRSRPRRLTATRSGRGSIRFSPSPAYRARTCRSRSTISPCSAITSPTSACWR